jgi:spore germination protein GerM
LFIGHELGGTLKREVHEIDKEQTLIQKIQQTVASLIQPTPDRWNPVIPEQTELLEVFITNSGVVYLNFNRHLQDRHIGGLSAELATVAAIVNTMLVNFQDIRQVQILVEGAEIETLAGHIDCRKPFSKMLLLNS